MREEKRGRNGRERKDGGKEKRKSRWRKEKGGGGKQEREVGKGWEVDLKEKSDSVQYVARVTNQYRIA